MSLGGLIAGNVNYWDIDHKPQRYSRTVGDSLLHRGEGSRDENLVLLLDGPHTGLGRPPSAGLAGLGAHAGALVEVLVHPDVSPLVQAAQLGIHAGG